MGNIVVVANTVFGAVVSVVVIIMIVSVIQIIVANEIVRILSLQFDSKFYV